MYSAERGAPWRTVLLCVGTAAVLCSLVAAHEKRSDMPQAPFAMGSRYGRSPERLMTPRNDRFFMGSRYGKRSAATAAGAPLLCTYTGVMALYECSSHLLLHKRAEESAGSSMDEE